MISHAGKKKKMLRVGIYNPYLTTLGGGEKYSLSIAEFLKDSCDVEVISRGMEDIEKIQERLALSLSKVRFKKIDLPKRNLANDKLPRPLKMLANFYHEYRLSAFTKKYDLFFCVANEIPIWCRAKLGFVILQHPFFKDVTNSGGLARMKLESYKDRIVYSEFTKNWIEKIWAVSTAVLYPYSDHLSFKPALKKKKILNVGRMMPSGHSKRQDALIQAFKKMTHLHSEGWELHLCGGLRTLEEEQHYFEELKTLAAGFPIFFHPNISYERLKEMYADSAIYWHAAGFGANQETEPWKMEHFGITTVEAMAAGCIPVVFQGGGQIEIVQHGQNGFYWKTLEDLIKVTTDLVTDKTMSEKISASARNRSRFFQKNVFQQELQKILNAYYKCDEIVYAQN